MATKLRRFLETAKETRIFFVKLTFLNVATSIGRWHHVVRAIYDQFPYFYTLVRLDLCTICALCAFGRRRNVKIGRTKFRAILERFLVEKSCSDELEKVRRRLTQSKTPT